LRLRLHLQLEQFIFLNKLYAKQEKPMPFFMLIGSVHNLTALFVAQHRDSAQHAVSENLFISLTSISIFCVSEKSDAFDNTNAVKNKSETLYFIKRPC